MFEKSGAARHKNERRVIVRIAGEPPFEAFVFLKVDERLIDLLNDQRLFIPIKQSDGATIIMSKRNIVSIIEKPKDAPAHEPVQVQEALAPEAAAAEPEPGPAPCPEPEPQPAAEEAAPPGDEPRARGRRRFDPYEILRVSPEASIEEIRRAYHARIKAVHPDSIAALDLDEDIARAANMSAQRVNRAYKLLVRERQGSQKSAENAA